MSAVREETILEVITQISRSLTHTAGLSEYQATQVSLALTRHLSELYGGERVYIHTSKGTDEFLTSTGRQRRIRAEFDGTNRIQLCEKYGISRSWFYRIISGRD